MRPTLMALLGLLLLAALTVPAGQAKPIYVGDCQPSGTCAAVCVAGVADCYNGELLCFGVSYEVPFCTHVPPGIIGP